MDFVLKRTREGEAVGGVGRNDKRQVRPVRAGRQRAGQSIVLRIVGIGVRPEHVFGIVIGIERVVPTAVAVKIDPDAELSGLGVEGPQVMDVVRQDGQASLIDGERLIGHAGGRSRGAEPHDAVFVRQVVQVIAVRET